MFPTQEVTISSVVETTKTGKTFAFDFDTGDFIVKDGKLVALTGLEGLKMWIKKVLKTERNKYKIYNTNNTDKYGISLLELVSSGYPRDYIETEIKSNITQTLIKNSEITAVNNFIFTRDVKRTLTVAFSVTSVYGTTTEGVTI